MRARAGWREVLTILFLAFSSPAAGAPFDDPEAAYRDARAAWVAGDVDAAAAIFAALAEQHPDNADYLLGHGQGLLATQRSAQAVPVLERALELAPAYLDVMQVLLRAYEILGEDTAAYIFGTEAGCKAVNDQKLYMMLLGYFEGLVHQKHLVV